MADKDYMYIHLYDMYYFDYTVLPTFHLLLVCFLHLCLQCKLCRSRHSVDRLKAVIERVDVMVMRRRLRWLGHLERMDDTSLLKCLLVCRLQASTQLGGRNASSLVLGDLKKCGLLPGCRDLNRVASALP